MAPKSPTKEMAPKSPTKEITLESSAEEVAPKSPTKEVAPKSPTREVAPKSPTKEVAPKSPTKEVAPKSPTKEVAPKSPTKEVAPKSPTKEVAPKSPTKEVAPKSPTKEVAPKSPTKEVAPKSPTKEVAPKSPTKEVAPKSPTKEVAPKSPTKEVAPKSPMKEVASRSPSKEIASKSPIKEAPSTLASRDAASKSPSSAKGTFPRSPDKEVSSKSPDKEILKSPLKEVAPKFTEKESRATPTSPLKEAVPRSPDREVKLKSSTKEVISVSPARDVAPRSPTKETSPVKDVARKSPAKEVSPKFPVKEVVTTTPAKQTPRKSPTKEVSSRLPLKESSQKTPPREDSSKLPVRPTDRKAPAKMPPGHLDKAEGEILPTTEVSTFSSTEVVVKQTFTEYRKDYEAELVVGQKLPLRTLVQRDAMAPRNFLVFIPSSGRTMRLEDALATWQVTEDNIVMVRSMNELVVMDQVAPEFTLDSATSEGMYNTKLKTFTNPKTKKPISFAEFVARKFVDFSNVTVQDFKTRKMITLEEALERNIVDRETGQMVHPETKKPVSFFEASVLGWIVWETTVVTQTRQLTLAQAIRGLSFDQEKVTFCHPLLQGVSGLHEALCDHVIDPSSVLVYSREQDTVVPLTELPSYLGSLDSNCYIHPFTGKVMSLDDAFASGYLLSDSHVLSIPVALERGMYDKRLKCFTHPASQEQLNILQAVQQGMIDGFGTVVVDPESNTHIPLVRAIEIGVVNVNDCSVASLPLELAICQGLVADKSKCPSGDIQDPSSGRPVGLWSAVRAGLIDAERLRVRAGEGRLVSCAEAVRLGLLEGASGCWMGPPQLTADEALRWGFLLDSAIPMPLQNALALGLYCSGTGTLRRPGGRGPSLTVQDAVLEGILEPDVLTVKVAHSGEMLSLTEAVGAGLLDPVAGTILDTECNITVDLYEAMGRGLVLPVAKVLPLLEIVLKNFYSPVTGLISSPFCERPQCLRDAVRSGFVSTGSTMVYSGDSLMSYITAVDCGLLDDRAGVLRVLGGPMDLRLAFERCHLLDISPPLNVKMALSLGLFDDQSGSWMDPASGCLLTLPNALDQRLLDDASTRVLQSKDDTRRTLVLSEALSRGKIDKICSKYVTEDGALIPLVSCFKEGLMLNVQPSTPLQRLIREGCYLETSNRFSIRGLSHTVSLGEVVMRRLVDPFLPFLPQPGQEPMHLMQACRMGLIELSLGLVREGQQLVPLVRALETGLVIDLEKPLTLVEAVQLGFCDPDSGRLLHPVEGSYLNLEEALELGIVTTRDSYVKDAETGQFLTFARAVESGTVDPVRNLYTPRDLNLYKAVFAKLIIYAKMPLSLGQAFADDLFDEDSGKFLDPRSSELLGFKDALNRGLLDRCSMLQESASSAFRASRGAVISRSSPSFSLSARAGSVESTSQRRPSVEIGNLQRGASKHGLLDQSSFLVKDTLGKRLLTLRDAIQEGILDAETGTVLAATDCGHISFGDALARHIFVTPGSPLSLAEALEYGVYRPTDGSLVCPWTGTLFPVGEQQQLPFWIDQSAQGNLPLADSKARGLAAPQASRPQAERSRTVLFHPTPDRAAAQERCKSCDEEIAQLSQWIEDIELRLANLGAVSEDSDSLRQQLSTAKSLREELELKQPRVLSLFDEVRQLSSSELLSRDETDALQRPLAQCRGRLELCQERSERLARRLAAALEELLKYTGEMQVFRTWLDNARKVLARHEELLDDIRNVADNADHYRAFSSDVIAHQADLRFITMAAQRFVDESKEYLRMLNDHRTSLPQRLSHLEPSESEVRAEVSHVSTEYQNLLSRVNKLGDQFSSLTERKRAYHEAMERATAWLNEAQRSAKRLLEEPTAAEPPAIQEQLERVRAFHLEAVGQGRLIETAKQAAQVLPPSGGPAVEEAVRNLEEVYQQMLSLVGERSKQLQTALVQSQDIADGLDRVLRLLDELEATQRGQSAKLASLMRDRLDEQIHEHRVLRSEIDGQRPFIDALNASARELPGNARLAKKVEAKLKDINSRYEKVLDRSTRRGELLDEVSSCLDQFTGMANRFEEWLASVLQAVEGEEQPRLEHAMNQRNLRKDEFEDLLRAGRALCAKRDVTDTGPVRDKVKQLEQQWKELGELLSERERQGRQRAEQGAAYETLRQQVLSWLQTTEGRLDSLGSLALDKDILRRQAAEIKPLVKEHAEYASTMDREAAPHKEPYANGAHDLSPVQQQLSEMNHRYHLLGVRLSDRQQEADSLSEELRTCTEALRTLLAFVKSRSVPRDLPASQELAHQQLTQLRELQTELQEKQLEVDRARLQAQELLRRRPQAPGSDALQSQLDELLSRWQGLQGALRSRLLLIQLLKEFQDTHDLLHNWLIQKDKMFQVLGPIATEPRLVAAQTQQVLCMRDELTSQEPLLRRLTTCAQELLDQLDDKDGPTARRLREQLDGIKRHWAEMVSRLEERERALGAATGASAEFQTVLARLLDSLQGVGDDFERLSEAGDCEAQLRRLAALEERLEAQRPPLAEAEARAENLCELLSDAASRSEVRARLGSAQKLYNGLNRKINNRKAELESSLKEDRGFFSNCDSIQEWLRGIQLSLAPDLKISADTDILHKQVTEFEPAYKSLLDKEHEEAQQLRTRLDGLRRGWDQLRKEATDRHTRLQRAFENCKKFNAAFNKFGPWLQSAEGRLSTLTLVNYQRAEVERQAKELQAFKNDLSRHSQEYDSVRNLGETFLAGCDVDKEGVKKDLDTLRTRWEKLNHGVTERSRQLDEVSSKLCEFQEKAGELGHGLQRLEDKLASHDALGEAARNPRLLDRLQGMAREADELRRGLDRLRAFTDTWLASASPDCDTSHIRSQLDALVRRHQQLAHDLQDRCGQLEEAGTVVAQYHAKVKTAQQDLSNLEEELESMGPIGRDIKTVRSQIDQVKSFQERLSSAAREVDKAEQECQELISQGYTQDAKGARAQVETLRRQLNRLEERARGRHSSLEAMLAKLEKFYEDLHTTQRRVGSALGEEHTFRPVAADVESLRSQQEQFKQFRKSHVEPLGREVDNVNRAGNALIQSASPGVNTTLLERDIDKLNDEWNQLKEKVGERERLLEAALLQSGKFQEALAGVARWLEDTEELVANQRAPSADYKVLKAQLQEQKFLNKLLLDRQGSMNSLQAMGTEVMRHLSSADKAHVQAQLHDLSQRFDRLVRGAQERTAALERTLPVARSFQEQLSPLVEWLEQTERRLTAMSTLPTDADRLAQRAQEHRELHRDVLGHKRAFEALTETAQQLMSLVGDDEAQAVVDSLQELTGPLRSPGEMESRLARYQVLSVYVEKLQEQFDELNELSEEVSDHQKQVDELSGSGQELMRHASGNDAIQLKDRLDSLQLRYTDLAQRAAERLRQAREALPVAQNFHTAHERLTRWMDDAEAQLRSLEAAALTAQESTMQRLEQELQEMRSVLEVVNHLGPQLCQRSPGEGAGVVESMVSRANRRFDAICEQIQRRAERLELSRQRSLEVTGDLEDLLDWFHEQKALSEEVSSQKGRVRDVLSAAKKVAREWPAEDQAAVRDRAEELRALSTRVAEACAERLAALEQALPLAEHLLEAHSELVAWLDEAESEAERLAAPAAPHPAHIQRQQERNRALLQALAEHKPLA
ncbi:hypothetical protein MTO96_006816 [Rhipicephalus appendiculatus]